MGDGYELTDAMRLGVGDIVGAAQNVAPYHLSCWKPATLYPVHSVNDLWLLVYGSYTDPMAIFYTQFHYAVRRGVELEAWRVYGKRPIKPMRQFRALHHALQLEMRYGKSAGLTFQEYVGRSEIVVHSGADLMPPPATGSTLLEGVLTHNVTRAFAQRWAKGGYVYPADEDPVTLNVLLCRLWQTMTYTERALHLTHREHSLLAAYYAIPHLAANAKPIEYAEDAPRQTPSTNSRYNTIREPVLNHS